MTGISTLGQALRQIENLNLQQQQFATLSTQLATGKKTQTYSGLNTDAITSVRARTSLTSTDVYINNIDRSNITINLTLGAIEEFQAQTQEFAKTSINFLQQGDHQTGDIVYYDDPATPEVETIIVGNTSANMDVEYSAIVDHANNLFGFLGELLNSQEGDRYLLAGADGRTKPFTDTGTLEASISTLILEWKDGNITTEELIADLYDGEASAANPNAITDSAIGFSAPITNGSAGDIFVRADENSEFKYTTLANERSLRDVIVTMAFLKNENLPPIVNSYETSTYPAPPDQRGAPGATASEQQDSFYELYNVLATKANTTIDDIDQIRFRLETVRAQMTETKQAHANEKSLLLDTVANIEDVDTNEVAVRLTTLQTQLQASYSVTSLTQNLSLVNFL